MKTQRNMRIHFLLAILILLLGIYLNFNSGELLILCAAITFVLLAEMINTALELTMDVISREFHPLAQKAKDVGAGAVLIASLNALITAYLLFSKRVRFSMGYRLERIKQSPWHITFISLILVLGLAVLLKVFFHRGTPLRGGMPSGHSAAAFSIWTAIAFSTSSEFIIVLSFILAVLIARSRLMQGIHNLWEVVAGAVLGALLTTLVFQLLAV